MLFVAQGGSWSQDSHCFWPDGFKAAARAFLLSAHVSATALHGAPSGPQTRARRKQWPRALSPTAVADGGSRQGSCLGNLPSEVVLHILCLTATPMSSWLPQNEPMFDLTRYATYPW